MSTGVLSARLAAAADLVRQGAILADIGTDHAHLPVFLMKTGKIARAILTDVNEGPLSKAKENVAEAGFSDRAEFILADGAACLDGKGVTDVTICGMGGELIADIIDRAPLLKKTGVSLILQPMSRPEELRSYLAANGFSVLREVYAEEGRRSYVLFLSSYTGEARTLTEGEAYFGDLSGFPFSGAKKKYTESRLRALETILRGKSTGGEDTAYETRLLTYYRSHTNT